MKIKVQCRFCNKYFYTQECWIKRGGGQYCNRECKDLKHGDLTIGRKHTEETKTKQSIAHLGSKNPAWIDGRSFIPYPLGWNDTFKEQIRYRDGYKCQNCGTPEIESDRQLDIHHKDCNKNNLKEDNLITLCRGCHISIHNKFRPKGLTIK